MAKTRLKKAIREAGLTQKQFAERLQVTTSTVERWISSGIDPQPYLIPDIRRILNSKDPCLFDEDDEHWEGSGNIMDFIRRKFGVALAQLFGISALADNLTLAIVTPPHVEPDEYLAQSSVALKSCWASLAHGDYTHVEDTLITHIPTLTRFATTISPFQSIAASLAVEAKILQLLLFTRNMQFRERDLACVEAVKFAGLSGDSNLEAITLDWHGNTYTICHNQPQKAIPILNNALNKNASPLVHSAIYGNLAIAHAQKKSEKMAIAFIEKAHLEMPAYPELEPSYPNIRWNDSELQLILGKVYLHLAEHHPQSNYAQRAYNAFNTSINGQVVSRDSYAGSVIWKGNALRVLGELDHCTDCLTEGFAVAVELGSKRRLNDLHNIVSSIPDHWEKEQKIQDLQKDVSHALVVARR